MSLNIAVLRGGPSSEYEVSLKTGKAFLNSLSKRHRTKDVVIDKQGVWYVGGFELLPAEALSNVDVVFNAMHGEFGEDGKVQQILERLNIPHTGPKAFGAALSIDKAKSKRMYAELGIKTPLHFVIDSADDLEGSCRQCFNKIPMPVILKPINKGSSVGLKKVNNYKDLIDSLATMLNNGDKVLVEEFIDGKEGTVGIIDNFRDQKVYSLLPTEIVLDNGCLFDYDAKYSGNTKEICPGNFSRKESEEMQEMAKLAHEVLNLRHYSRSDFRIHPRRGVFIIETNSLPGMTEASLFPQQLDAVGISYDDFVEHLITLALNRK